VLPSIIDGWRFNFNKHSENKGFETYVLVKEESENIVEGCLIFEMKDKAEPYMAFVEVAPLFRVTNVSSDPAFWRRSIANWLPITSSA
jgi:hypothetical protein